jgi:poly(hydroxyalkanoate) depolymerase family esterase
MKLNSSIFAQMQSTIGKWLSTERAGTGVAIGHVLARLRGKPLPPGATQTAAPEQNRAQTQNTARPKKAAPGANSEAVPNAAPARPATMPAAAPKPANPQEFAQEFMARSGVPDVLGLHQHRRTSEQEAPAPKDSAQFLLRSYSNAAGTRDYKLYIPANSDGKPMPLLVMLHGCTQNPDDFAAGTQMNALAEERQCLVAYPAQAKSINASKCWNWFNALDQKRDQGEPSIIAGIAQQIINEYAVDPRQIFVAGLSAGGAMAVIVGTLYPEMFAAVGVHSGLPFAAARDLPSALVAMRAGANPVRTRKDGGLPIIVFHGDRDTTVHPRNGDALMVQGLNNQTGGKDAPAASVHEGNVPNGHRYTQTTHTLQDGSPLAEHWVIHGAGHAWSGGSAHGSYTDAKGPDASREMMRFFETVG